VNPYTQRPKQPTGRGRFWLALSLSTVTAASVAVPLALKAVNAERTQRAPAAPNQEQVEVPPVETATTLFIPDIRGDEDRSGRGNIVPAPEAPSSSATESETTQTTEAATTTTTAPTTSEAETTVTEPPTETTVTTVPPSVVESSTTTIEDDTSTTLEPTSSSVIPPDDTTVAAEPSPDADG
jgi:hypothetical protein